MKQTKTTPRRIISTKRIMELIRERDVEVWDGKDERTEQFVPWDGKNEPEWQRQRPIELTN